MKIVIINQHPYDTLGGSEIQCDLIASVLVRNGHNVTYLAIDGRQHSYTTDYQTLPLTSFAGQLYRILREIGPDVIYWRYNKKHLLVSTLIAKLLGITFVYALSHISDSRVWVRSGNRPLERLSTAFSEGVDARAIVRSLTMLVDPLLSALNYSGVPLFVDAAVHQISTTKNTLPVRRQILIRNSMTDEASPFQWPRPYVVWVASIKAKKNPSVYLQLAEKLDSLDIDFVMIGAIQDSNYEYLLSPRSGPTNFHYLGPRSLTEVNGILREALFLVHTCNPEGFPNNLIQAWLQAKPTISLYYDPEGLIEAQGLGFYSRSFDNLVSDVRKLVTDASLREEIGARAVAFATEHFDPQKNVRRLEEFLESLKE
jgi:glycosyltransferase involved in cell wall biosynthesis